MPEWAVTVIVALIAASPGLASWVKVAGDNRRAKEQGPTEQKQLLQVVANEASATALKLLESATEELRLQLNDTRLQSEAQQREIEALTKRLAETERELAQVKAELKKERQSNERMAERIRQLEEERATLLRRIDELEACR